MNSTPARLLVLALCASLAGCVYVTRTEFDDFWDKDGDGWPLDDDCDPNNPEIYPFAPDLRGDGCDADCGRELDSDGDDWPDLADCAPSDPDSYPCSPMEVDGDGIDNDCDGRDTARDPGSCPTADPDFEDAPDLSGDCGGGE